MDQDVKNVLDISEELSLGQLVELHEAIAKLVDDKKAANAEDLKTKAAEMATLMGISADDLLAKLNGKKGTIGRVKYVNPATNEEWLSGGKGHKKPDWLKGHEKAYRIAA